VSETPLRTDDFDYQLPAELIAQTPIEPRDASRLLVLPRAGGPLRHDMFRNLGSYLRAGDVLVANESRVLPARLEGRKATGGRVEVLLLRRRDERTWEALVGGRGVRPGSSIAIVDTHGTPTLEAQVVEQLPHGGRLLRFDAPVDARLAELGSMPLPPYITAPLADGERYQTVYSRSHGSAAAPTAGLHFTPELLERLRGLGVEWHSVVLHVGLDTFRPVQVDDPERHVMHSEWIELPASTAEAINKARREQRRVIAVGTTTVRVLETAGQLAEGPTARPGRPEQRGSMQLEPFSGDTAIFIYPPYRFRVVDGLITNFHLPRSTLLMLVSALAGRERILDAYREAVRERYRFFSFGDAMLIL